MDNQDHKNLRRTGLGDCCLCLALLAAFMIVPSSAFANPPDPPIITSPTNASVTKNQKPPMSGTAEANSTVEVFDDIISLGTTTADGIGNWAFTPGSNLSAGIHTITAIATRVGGGSTSDPSSVVNILIDLTTLTPLLISPASHSSNVTVLPVGYTLPEAPTGNTVKLTFKNASNAVAAVVTLFDSTSSSFYLDTQSINTDSHVNTTTANLIPDGTYTVILSYQDGAGNDPASQQATNVAIDATTLTPILTSPASDVAVAIVPVAYSLPEAPLTGTVTLSFLNDSDVSVATIQLSDATSASFSLNSQNITPNSNIISSTASSIANGTYRVRLSYQDVHAHSAASAQSTGIAIISSLDSDGDGVTDSQELIDGTNRNDAGSFVARLPTSWCSEWNGFLGMYNINEYVNLDSSSHSVTATIYDVSGVEQSSTSLSVLAGAQTDLLVHDLSGWTHDSYGKVCSEVTDGDVGDIGGRMVYYKPAESGYQFAFAMPFEAGYSGDQFTTFNTYQPSLDPVDSSNLVTNWIQITNLEATSQTGTLYYYSQAGAVLASDAVSLAAGARQDFSGHQFGPNLVGILRWHPNSGSAKFLMRNTRYYYDNAGSTNSFSSAMQVEGVRGTEESIAVPLDTNDKTAVLEVANVSSESDSVAVNFYDASGNNVSSQTLNLAAYGSQHIVADTILNGGLGMATVQGGSAMAVGMHYGRTTSAGIQFVYGIIAKQPLGSVLRGSYNTFLNQDCELLLVNTSESAVSSTISMTRYDGTVVLADDPVSTPAHGVTNYSLCSHESANFYGVVSIQPETTNTIFPTVVRIGANDDYRFPTEVK